MISRSVNPWLAAKASRGPAAVLAALHLTDPRPEPAESLDRKGWDGALAFADRAGLTLILSEALSQDLPDWVQGRVAQDLIQNRARTQRIAELRGEVAARLTDAAIRFVALKGVTHCPMSGLLPERRVQYDLDFWTLREQGRDAVEALRPLGFESFEAMEQFPADHLPPLIRKTGWQFRGDYFDPEIPTAIEVHFRLWNEPATELTAPGLEAFWERRTKCTLGGVTLPVLAPVDSLGFAALHLLKHLLFGSVRPFHVYELARMLERQSGDEGFWRVWQELHPPALRRLESLSFFLAQRWFGCVLVEPVEEEYLRFSPATRAWFESFALSPANGANKNEIWLHCSLLESKRRRWKIARRKLIPERLPPPVDGVYLPQSALTWRRRVLRAIRQSRFVMNRCRHHLVATLRLAGSGARWWWRMRALRG